MKKIKTKIVLILLILILLICAILLPREALSDQMIIAESQSENLNIPVEIERDHATDLAQAIAVMETGGTLDCSRTGLSGEKGCHQFLPSTWASYSKEVYGYVEVQTPEKATFVTEEMIRKWIALGYSDRQIFLIWNQGNPGACKSGINKFGVKYDSCGYAEDALVTLQKVIHNTL